MPSHSEPGLTREEIRSWPKAELHSHLDGAMRLETMLDLATAQGQRSLLPANSVDGLIECLGEIDRSENLEAYLSWFRYTLALMQDARSLRRVAYEMAEDMARDGVVYLEVRFAPVLCTKSGLTLEQVLKAVLDGLMAAKADFGIRTGVIVCALRDRYRDASQRQAEVGADFKHRGVVGFDLAGAEAGNPAVLHAAAFAVARKHLLGLTVHAGEAWGPESIREALFDCGAHRIGHGVALVRDDGLLQYVVDHRIPLEICPTSNVQTNVVASYESHPLSQLVEAGVPVSINTDNLLFSHTRTSDELYLAYTRCGLSARQTRQIAADAFRQAFLHFDERMELARTAEIIQGAA